MAVYCVCILSAQGLVASELEFNSLVRRFGVQPLGVAMDPDGRHLYTTEPRDNGVGIYRIDPATGRPQFVTIVQGEEAGIEDLFGPKEILVSLDGRHVYVACQQENLFWGTALVVFAREKGTGHLVYVETLRNGSEDIYGLMTPTGLAMSSDDRFLYVSARWRHSVSVFSRNVRTGKLAPVQELRNGEQGISFLRRPSTLALSPDGAHVYATSHPDDSITVFTRDPESGRIGYLTTHRNGLDGIQGLVHPERIAMSPDGASLYVTAADSVVHFNRDVASGFLSYVDTIENSVGGVSDLEGAYAIAVSADGLGVAVTASTGNALLLFDREPMSGELTFSESHVDQVAGVTGLSEPAAIASNPANTHLYLGTVSGEGIPVFEYDAQAGTASFVEGSQEVDGVKGLWGPGGMVISGDGSFFYVSAYKSNSVLVFARNRATGHLSFVQRLKQGYNGVDGIDGPGAVALSPDGAYVYFSGHGEESLAVFSRDAAAGTLEYVSSVKNGVDGVDGLGGVKYFAISPGGDHLYAAGREDHSVVVFDRDHDSGALTVREVVRDGENGVDGLEGAYALTLSPDGAYVYVSGSDENAIAVFARDQTTGTLSFVEAQRNSYHGVVSMNRPKGMTLSPDGLHLYVTAYNSSAVVVFEREPSSGALTFVEAQANLDGLYDLWRPFRIRVSPDGSRVYSNTQTRSYSVCVFSRDTSTGALTHLDFVRRHVPGVYSMVSAHDLILSPEGEHLYITSIYNDSVIGFRRWRPATDGVPGRIEVDRGLSLFAVDVEPCAQNLTVELTGLGANLNLSTRFGQPPTASDFDCRSDQPGTADELCVHAAPAAGRWWIGVEGVWPTWDPVGAMLTAAVEGCEGQNQVSWWRADGDADDALGLNDGIAQGGLSYAPAPLDQAFVMSDDGDAVMVPDDVSLDVGVSNFSYSLWLQTNDRRPFRSLVDSRTVDPVTGFQIFLDRGKPGVQIADGTGVQTVVSDRNLADGRFHHLSVTADRDAPNGLKIYVDRKVDTLADVSGETGIVSSFEGLNFGRRTDSTSGEGYFNGMIDEVRLSHRALPRREAVDALGGLRSWWPGDGDATDHGGLNHAQGTPGYTRGIWHQAFEFGEAPDDHLVVSHHPSLDFGTGDFSIVGWLKTSNSLETQVVLDSRVSGPVGFAFAVDQRRPSLVLADGASSLGFSANRFIADGRFHFVVVTVDRDASDGITIWVDGELVETFDPTAVSGSVDSGAGLTIGQSSAAMGSGQQYIGAVDELEIYDRVLTETEIGWLSVDHTLLLFEDGFEAGDVAGWSSTSP